MRPSNLLRELSINNINSTPIRHYFPRTPSAQSNDHSNTYNLSMYQPWAKPLILEFNINPSRSIYDKRQENLIKQRKMMSTLKYRKVIGDRFRKESIKGQLNKTAEQPLIKARCNTTSRISNKSAVDLTPNDQIQVMKQTLTQSCQTRPVQLQNRPMSCRRACRTEASENHTQGVKLKEVRRKVRAVTVHKKARKQTCQQISGW